MSAAATLERSSLCHVEWRLRLFRQFRGSRLWLFDWWLFLHNLDRLFFFHFDFDAFRFRIVVSLLISVVDSEQGFKVDLLLWWLG